jgi:phosphatidylglycerol:prolipoprotein diacylglycerol transferase
MAIVFAAVGDLIIYFIFDLVYHNVSYEGQPLSERFPIGTEYPIAIYSYGFFLMLAFIFGTIFLIIEGKREKIGSDLILDMMTVVIIGSIIGARLIYFLLKQEEFRPQEIAPGQVIPGAPWWDITRGGLSIHGGILGALILGIFFCKMKKVSFWKMVDFTIVAVPLGIFFGRIGCFLNGCCYGVKFEDQANCPWFAIRYPTVKVPADMPGDPPYPMDGLFRHPAPLYMAIAALLLFFYLVHFRRHKSRFHGHTFLMFALLYSLIRFIQEMYRFDASSVVIGEWLTIAQLASIIIGVVALFIILEINRRISIAERLAAEMEEAVEVPVAEAPEAPPLPEEVEEEPEELELEETGPEEEGPELEDEPDIEDFPEDEIKE